MISSDLDCWIEDEERKISLDYQAFPKQREFHECDAKYRLFGGAAGPGKSKALLMEAIAQALEIPGSNTLLLRRTFPELESSLLLYFRRDVPREFYRSFNEAKHTVTWHNGSTTRFGYLQSEHDIYQYQSGEYLFIGIDELTHFTLRQWQFLTSRNRCPVRGSHPCMAGATNPGNIGHAWVKSLFIDKQPAAGMEPGEYDPNDYAFIAARVSDNPIYASDLNYLKTLEQLPDFYRRAFLDGDWTVFAGQYFTNFSPAQNVIRAEQIGAADWWPRWISVDWGFEHPAAVYWHTQVPPAEYESTFRAGARLGSPGRGDPCLWHVGPDMVCRAEPSGPAEGTSPYIKRQRASEDQRHRLTDYQTRDLGDGPSANNLAIPPAGDDDPLTPNSAPVTAAHSHSDFPRCSPRSFPPTRAASPSRNAAASPLLETGSSMPEAGEKRNADSSSCHETRGTPRNDNEKGSADLQDKQKNRNRAGTTITYREFVAQHLSPRVLAAQIIERSRLRDGRTEKIEAIYLSPDAFARRTDEASIAEQMGDILASAGLPRPVPADNDRIGGWMLMYQMLDSGEWVIADSCPELIRTLPELVRDESNIEDIAKRDGDDAADAARYGLKSRASARPAKPPWEQEFEARITSSDPTIRAIQIRKAELDLPQRNRPILPPWSRWRRR